MKRLSVPAQVRFGVQHTVHGGQFFEDIGQDFSNLSRKGEIVNADVLDAWYDPAPAVIDALREDLPWLIRTSPPTRGDGLRTAIASARGIPETAILIGGGSSALIFGPLLQIAKRYSSAVVLDPMYGEYKFALTNAGISVTAHRLLAQHNFAISIEALAAESADICVVVNPNNPTGQLLGTEGLKELASAFKLLIVDETYIDFTDGESAESMAAEADNVIVIKSLSKFYALSGLRVGYMVGNPTLIAALETATPPWSVGTVAQLAAIKALQEQSYYNTKQVETRQNREWLFAELSHSNLMPYPSTANFLLVRTDSSAEDHVCKLRSQGIHIRNCDSQSEQFRDDHIRIAVKSLPDCRRIVEALKAT